MKNDSKHIIEIGLEWFNLLQHQYSTFNKLFVLEILETDGA